MTLTPITGDLRVFQMGAREIFFYFKQPSHQIKNLLFLTFLRNVYFGCNRENSAKCPEQELKYLLSLRQLAAVKNIFY